DLRDFDDGHVEGAAAEVVDGDFLVAGLLVHAVGQRRRGRLVDDALDLEPGDAPGVLGRLALRVVEVGRHGDHRFRNLRAEIILGRALHLLQHFGGDFRWRHLVATRFHPGVAIVGLDDVERHDGAILLRGRVVKRAPDQAFDRVQRVRWIGDRLTLGRTPDQRLLVVGKRDHAWRGALAFGVFDDPRLVAIQYGDTRIRGAQINTYDFAHDYLYPVLCAA